MVLSFVFFLYVLVFICMSFPVLLFCGSFFSINKKKKIHWEENQTSFMVKKNIIKAKSQFH